MTTHPKCGKSWGGFIPEHCGVCCETFGGTRAGDMHRKGPYTARYCADPASVGLVQDAKGIWRRRDYKGPKRPVEGNTGEGPKGPEISATARITGTPVPGTAVPTDKRGS